MAPTSRSGDLDETVPVFFLSDSTRDQRRDMGSWVLRSRQQGRVDDTEVAVRRRQQIYHDETRPVLDVYTARGLVVEIDGLGEPATVTSRILTQLNQKASVAL
jgi:adenylate kinase